VNKYGFVHLVSQNDEIIAFNCPDEDCLFTVQKKLPRDQGKEFYSELNNELDPAGLENANFIYFSSPPFSDVSYKILETFEVSEILVQVWEFKYYAGNPCIFDEKYYSAFNGIDSFLFGEQFRDLNYLVGDARRLLEREETDNLRLFPRSDNLTSRVSVQGRLIGHAVDILCENVVCRVRGMMNLPARQDIDKVPEFRFRFHSTVQPR